jgi:hypothetical protein
MAEVSSMTQTKVVDVEFTAPPLQLPDAASMAEATLAKALEFCAQKMGFDSHQAVVDHLRQGDSTAYSYYHYSLAKQTAESLGALDENVKAVYVCDYDATPEDLCFGEATQASLVHLIVWAQRKTGALNSLVAALDRALVQSYADLIGMRQLTHLLDVQVIDDADVESRIGYGAMLSSIHHRPIQVWER